MGRTGRAPAVAWAASDRAGARAVTPEAWFTTYSPRGVNDVSSTMDCVPEALVSTTLRWSRLAVATLSVRSAFSTISDPVTAKVKRVPAALAGTACPAAVAERWTSLWKVCATGFMEVQATTAVTSGAADEVPVKDGLMSPLTYPARPGRSVVVMPPTWFPPGAEVGSEAPRWE